ncbi:carboxylesterase/lipase family protein [Streptomyces sp. XD-27]|uniref:carboxylesterase/lipase family protein n=1 Tax=Streptomyces sp. XD-27 TaxID=3062779 RepID=UPI0026F4699C|nr:carboxylesterase family protein [Streptomyces sp. XD-27]WKX73660.1 carboxylesterase family protein [Streptomyces sp. XD-27]
MSPSVMSPSRLARRRGGALCALLLALLAIASASAPVSASGPAAPPAPPGAPAEPVVTTGGGPVRGRAHGAYHTFEGIPYAAPPTGPLRWRAPVPPRPWQGVRDAGAPGPRCMQEEYNTEYTTMAMVGSEDCLYLNVTVPSGRPAPGRNRPVLRDRPVMVWMHGGAFVSGAGSEYAAERLAVQGDAVVVTVNYRLGVFGFFGHPALGNAPDNGLADQQAALRWVRANARSFGGDPHNVTLFGESAGGLSACAHLVSPTSAGLFHKAVLQSGSCMTTFPVGVSAPGSPAYTPFAPQATTQAVGAAVARRLGCAEPAKALPCLRALPARKLATRELMETFSRASYGNALLPVRPDLALESGRFHRMPVIQGTNHDELRYFVGPSLAAHPIRDARDYRARLKESYGRAAAAVEARYPLSAYGTPALAWAAVLTDSSYACTTLRAHRALAAHVPTYGYEFNDATAPVPPGVPPVAGFPYGAAHGFELPYLFATRLPFTADQRALSDRMIGYWTRFAHTGDPNGTGAPAWRRFDRTPLVQSLAPGTGGVRPVDLGAGHHCGFWDRQLRG